MCDVLRPPASLPAVLPTQLKKPNVRIIIQSHEILNFYLSFLSIAAGFTVSLGAFKEGRRSKRMHSQSWSHGFALSLHLNEPVYFRASIPLLPGWLRTKDCIPTFTGGISGHLTLQSGGRLACSGT